MGAASLVRGLVTALLLGIITIGPRFDPIRAFSNERLPKLQSEALAATHELYCGLWRVDGGFLSTIHIKNSLIVGPLDVTPVLYMADGAEYALPAVHLPISGV